MAIDPEYIKTIRERSKKNRVYSKHQSVGLMLSYILSDEDHKSLYMKLAKSHDETRLLSLAKDISEKKNIKNKGAYFMKVLSLNDHEAQNHTSHKA